MVPLPVAAGLTVLKVGGSLAERGDPRELMRATRGLAAEHPLVIVPGGADFAEAVRRADARFSLLDETAHRMALLAMDQYGLLLADLAGAEAARDQAAAVQIAHSGRLAVLLPSGAVWEAPLPASWEVTSDTIAAWLAGQIGAGRLVLLKDVDGAFAADPRTAAGPRLLRRAALRDLSGVVDPAFARHLPCGIQCWILNGSFPARLAELLQTGSTTGTEVVA